MELRIRLDVVLMLCNRADIEIRLWPRDLDVLYGTKQIICFLLWRRSVNTLLSIKLRNRLNARFRLSSILCDIIRKLFEIEK